MAFDVVDFFVALRDLDAFAVVALAGVFFFAAGFLAVDFFLVDFALVLDLAVLAVFLRVFFSATNHLGYRVSAHSTGRAP